MRSRLERWVNSAALRLPRSILAQLGLDDDSVIEMSVVDGALLIRPAPPSRPTLQALVDAIAEDNRHEETHWGPAVGAEGA